MRRKGESHARKEQEEAEKEQRGIAQLKKDKQAKEKGVASSKEMMLTLAEKGVVHFAATQLLTWKISFDTNLVRSL